MQRVNYKVKDGLPMDMISKMRKRGLILFAHLFILFRFIITALAEPALAQENSSAEIVRPNIKYEAEGRRDPFESYIKKGDEVPTAEPQADVSITLPSLTIQGIILGRSLKQAIINNKVVEVGDTIEEARIIDIDKEGIIVFYKNRQYNLPSPAEIILGGLKKKPEGGIDEKQF